MDMTLAETIDCYVDECLASGQAVGEEQVVTHALARHPEADEAIVRPLVRSCFTQRDPAARTHWLKTDEALALLGEEAIARELRIEGARLLAHAEDLRQELQRRKEGGKQKG